MPSDVNGSSPGVRATFFCSGSTRALIRCSGSGSPRSLISSDSGGRSVCEKNRSHGAGCSLPCTYGCCITSTIEGRSKRKVSFPHCAWNTESACRVTVPTERNEVQPENIENKIFIFPRAGDTGPIIYTQHQRKHPQRRAYGDHLRPVGRLVRQPRFQCFRTVDLRPFYIVRQACPRSAAPQRVPQRQSGGSPEKQQPLFRGLRLSCRGSRGPTIPSAGPARRRGR